MVLPRDLDRVAQGQMGSTQKVAPAMEILWKFNLLKHFFWGGSDSGEATFFFKIVPRPTSQMNSKCKICYLWSESGRFLKGPEFGPFSWNSSVLTGVAGKRRRMTASPFLGITVFSNSDFPESKRVAPGRPVRGRDTPPIPVTQSDRLSSGSK